MFNMRIKKKRKKREAQGYVHTYSIAADYLASVEDICFNFVVVMAHNKEWLDDRTPPRNEEKRKEVNNNKSVIKKGTHDVKMRTNLDWTMQHRNNREVRE